MKRITRFRISNTSTSPDPKYHGRQAGGRVTHIPSWVHACTVLPALLALAPAATHAAGIIFADSRLPDIETLARHTTDRVVTVEKDQDALEIIAETVADLKGLDAIHLVSHGHEGKILLGRNWIDSSTLDANRPALQSIGGALTDGGDILVHGCEVAAGSGRNFIERLAELTGADVAASTNVTGPSSLGGDWTLEARTGPTGNETLLANARYAQTLNTLAAGDVVVIGWNATNNTVRLAPLVTLPAGTVLKITDRGWTGSAFTTANTGDGTVTWTLSAEVNAGSLLDLKVTGTGTGSGNGTASLLNVTTGADLSANVTVTGYTVTDPMLGTGDGIFIYQDLDSNPFFIFGLNNSAQAATGPNGWNTSIIIMLTDSLLPNGTGSQNALTNGTNAIGLPGGPSQQDNVQYNGPITTATRTEWLARIASASNWTGDNTGTATGTISNLINITPPNAAPVIANLNGDSVTFTEEGSSVLLDAGTNATVTDSDNLNFASGSLTVSIANNRVSTEDILSINSQGISAGQIGLSGNIINYGSIVIGTFTGGTGTSNLVISFNSNATPQAVQALVRNLSYGNTNTANPATAVRSVTIILNDGAGGISSTNTVAVTVMAINDAPVAVADSITVNEGGTATVLTGGATSVLANDSDPEGSPLTAVLVTGCANGTLTLNANGTFSYTHNGSETTSDSFTYQANDGTANGNIVTVTITITPINDAPIALDDSIAVNQGGTATILTGGFTSVLHNDTDAENSPLTAVVVTGPTNGLLTLNSNGTFSYTHNGSITSSDSFTYRVNDGAANSNTATVSITITLNQSPVLGNLNGDSVAWAGLENLVTLDAGGNATATDAELGALNSGNGNWSGATLTVQRAGGAVSSDVLGFNTLGALFTISGSNLQSGGLTFATYTNTGGTLTISFTSSSTAATTALVNNVLQHIIYRNDTPSGDATVRFSLSDGVSTSSANVTVTSDIIYITNTTDTATINLSNGVSFSEAVAIAASDGTGSQTLVFTNSFTSGMSLAGNLAIAESLTINADAANGLSINGSTITLGGGTTLNFTNASGTVTIASNLAGTGSLSKSGASGTLVLTSSSNEANMSGGITVTGGALQISNDDYLSSGTLTLNGGMLTNNSTSFTLDNAIAIGVSGGTINVGGGGGATVVNISGVISGNGTLIKNGQAILQLDGNNTFTGGFAINAGTVIANHSNAFGTTAGTTTVASDTSVRINGGLSISETFTVSGTGKMVSAIEYGVLHLVSGISTLSGNVTFTGDTNIGAASGATLTLSGALGGGAYNLNKIDAGTVILSNSGNEVGLTGGTTVTAGTLSIGNDDHLPAGTITLNGGTLAITGATTVDNAVTLPSPSTISVTANATLSGALSGANALTKNGASTLTLAGSSSSHFGAVNVTTGGLTLSGGSAIGNTSAVTLSSSTTLTISSTETFGSLAGAGSVVLNAGLTTGGDNTSTSYSGVISGSFGLTKAGSGTLTLTGNNTFTGDTNITAGRLTINGVGGTLNDVTSVTVSSGATLALGSNEIIGLLSGAGTVSLANNELTVGGINFSSTFSGGITGSGILKKSGIGTFTLSGTNSGQSWRAQVFGGTLAVAGDANLGTGTVQLDNGTLSVTSASTIDNAFTLGASGGILRVDSGLAVTLSGAIGGSGGLTKQGDGALTLSNSNNYPGATQVSAGTLRLTGSIASATTVGTGATLSGGGTVGGNVTISDGGSFSPGASGVGTFTINGNLDIQQGGTLYAEINGTTPGTTHDSVIVNGTVKVSNANLVVTHGYSPDLADSYTIIDNNAGDNITGPFNGLAEGGTITAGGNGTVLTASYIGGSGNDFTLTAPTNRLPVVSNVDGDIVAYTPGATVSLDVNGDAVVSDAEDDFGTWNGGNLVVRRVTGGTADPTANDIFGFDWNIAFTVSGNRLQFATLTFATFTNTGGVLTIQFTGGGLPVSTALVDHLVENITYRNDTPYGDAVIRLSVTDSMGGTTHSDVNVTCSTIFVDQTNDDAAGKAADGFSLREALARGAAQPDADTIVPVLADNSTVTFGSGVTSGAGDTLNLDSANGLTITGSTLTLGGAFTITNGDGDSAYVATTLAGTSTLTKSGAGLLSLTSMGNEAGFSGAMAITGGVLSANADDVLGSGPLQFDGGTLRVATGGVIIDNAMAFGSGGGTLEANVDWTASGTFSGGGTLSKTGLFGILTLSGASAHTGTTSLGEGILAVSGDSNLGSGTLEFYGGTFSVTTTGQTIDNAVNVTSRSGAIDLGFGIQATLSGVISGTGDMHKSGSGTLVLTNLGNSAGSWSFGQVNGRTIVTAASQIGGGTLKLAGGTLEINATSSFTLNRTTQVLGAVTVDANGSNAGVVLNFDGVTSGNGALTLNAGDSAIYLSQASSLAGDVTIASTGAGRVGVVDTSTLGSGQINLTAGATFGVAGSSRTLPNNIVLLGDAKILMGFPAAVTEAITFSGVISESGGTRNLTVDAYSSGGNTTDVVLSGINTYSGTTTLVGGSLRVASDANLGSGTINLNAGTLAITGATTVDNLIGLNGLATIQADAAATLSGVISGLGSLTKSGTSTLTLSGSSAYSGTTTVSAGNLSVTGSIYSTTTIADQGTLSGTGSIRGRVTAQSGATISPGTSSGILTIDGDLTMASGSTLAVEINGTTAGTGHDQLVVTGVVDVTSASLAVTTGYTPAPNDAYTILNSTSGAPVVGAFAGIQEGVVFTGGGNGSRMRPSYVGGTGNDITLNAIVNPLVTSVSSMTADGTYKIDDSITITMTFDQAVNVAGGSPSILLETGTTDRSAIYAGGTGTNTLSFVYTVGENDVSADLDYHSTTAVALNGATLRNASGQDAILTLPTPGDLGSIANQKAFIIDGIRPTVASVSVPANGVYVASQSLAFTVNFTQVVTVDTNGGTPYIPITLDTGGIVQADYISGTGSSALTFQLLVTGGMNDADGVTVGALTLNGGTIRSGAGNDAVLTLNSVGATSGVRVDAVPPAALSIVVADTSLKVGETSTVTVTFSEAVSDLTPADFTIPNGSPSILSTADGGITWTFTLTPDVGVESASNKILLDNSGVTDAAGNAGTGTTESNSYAVDTKRPHPGSIVVADPTLKAGETSTVIVTFSEAVSGLTTEDFTIPNGSPSIPSTPDGGITWTFTLTPDVGVESASNKILLDNSGVTDAAGNAGTGTTESNSYAVDTKRPHAVSVVVTDTALKAGETSSVIVTFSEAVSGLTPADFTIPNGSPSILSTADGGITWTFTLTPDVGVESASNTILLDNSGVTDAAGNAGTGTTESNSYAVDTKRPHAVSIIVADTALKAGETSSVTVTFSEAITSLEESALTVGGGTISGPSTADSGVTWTATLFPDAGVESAVNIITLDNSKVTDAAGNTGAGTTESDPYSIDTKIPVIASVVLPPGMYTQGQSIPVTVTFSEAVTFTGAGPTTPVCYLSLVTDHGGPIYAVYTAGSGTTHTFTAYIPAGVADVDGVVLEPALELNGGAIRDAADNDVAVPLNNIIGASAVFIDSIPPEVSSPIPDQVLVIGETPVTIDLQNHFTDIGSTTMSFTATPVLATKVFTQVSANILTLTGLENGTTYVTVTANDGHGGTVSDTFEVAVGTAEPSGGITTGTTGTLNPSTGLFELTVTVTNTTPRPINGFRLQVDASAYLAAHPSLTLYNATATTAPGVANIEHRSPMAVDEVAQVKLTYYTSTRLFPDPFNPIISVTLLTTDEVTGTNGPGVQASITHLPDGGKTLTFPATAGGWYRVSYSHDLVEWHDCPIPLQATGGTLEWIDRGPPFTSSPPISVPARFYIIREIVAP